MKTNKFVILVILMLVVTFASFAQEAKPTLLTKVVAIKVCMVNDQLFERDQIPVEVEGKTYYGCCKMCKKSLAEKREFRVATDPVSGKEVDKATAVIGADKEG